MDSQVEISMTVMWPLESWPEFSQVVMNLLEGRSRQHLGEDGSQGTSVLDLRFTQMSRQRLQVQPNKGKVVKAQIPWGEGLSLPHQAANPHLPKC